MPKNTKTYAPERVGGGRVAAFALSDYTPNYRHMGTLCMMEQSDSLPEK